ncbi:MAG: hypothetical protein ABJA69_12835, partial [Acidobacteriaceae bacterium]
HFVVSSLREATTPVEMTGYFEIEPLPRAGMPPRNRVLYSITAVSSKGELGSHIRHLLQISDTRSEIMRSIWQ